MQNIQSFISEFSISLQYNLFVLLRGKQLNLKNEFNKRVIFIQFSYLCKFNNFRLWNSSIDNNQGNSTTFQDITTPQNKNGKRKRPKTTARFSNGTQAPAKKPGL